MHLLFFNVSPFFLSRSKGPPQTDLGEVSLTATGS